jgi:spermidine/putrescine transport system permease protein
MDGILIIYLINAPLGNIMFPTKTPGSVGNMSIEKREARQPWILLTPALTAIVLLLIVPLMFIVVYSFWLKSAVGADTPGFYLDNWQEALTDPFYRDILLNTLKIAAVTTLVCAVLGYPAAYFIARSKGNKLILLVLLMLPFWISYIIRTMSWINILGVSGALNSVLLWTGLINEPIQMLYNETTVIIGLVHFLLPFMVLNIFVSLDGIDRNLEDAASSLGATRLQGFFQVTLPLSMPGLAAGGLLCFVLAAGTYITPVVLGGPRDAMFANLVYEAIIRQLNWPLGSALSLLLLLVLGVLVAIYNRYLGMAQLAKGLG